MRNLTSQSKPQNIQNPANHRQTGRARVIGIIAMTLLVIVVISVGLYFVSHQEKPGLVYQPPAVTADDKLSEGKSNNELLQDARVINEAIKRGGTQRSVVGVVLDDQPQTIGDSASDPSTTVETNRLSALQTAFISESDRRLKALNDTVQLLPKLTTEQQTSIKKLVTDETTVITGLKAKAASEATPEAFSQDKTNLDKQYGNYLLAIAQVNLLVWANDQAAIETKVNILGGKYQERLNEAGGDGKDTASAQILVNSLQANKTTSTGLTASVLKDVPVIKAGEYNANRSVLKTYYAKLSIAHDQLGSVIKSASGLTVEMRKL